jgi:hypothetical protein
MYDYEASAPGELSMKEDEELNIIDREDEWLLVQSQSPNGKAGFVPANYVEEVTIWYLKHSAAAPHEFASRRRQTELQLRQQEHQQELSQTSSFRIRYVIVAQHSSPILNKQCSLHVNRMWHQKPWWPHLPTRATPTRSKHGQYPRWTARARRRRALSVSATVPFSSLASRIR